MASGLLKARGHAPAIVLSLLLVAGCDPEGMRATADGDLPLGDVVDEGKADGTWGSALTCKTVPSLPPLKAPHITVSIDGLTLHLTDAATGYDKVFPVGPGAINHDQGETSYGESLSLYPVIATGQHEFAITPSTIQPCKFWWTDPETGVKQPVFAGLPFLSWYGNYAIHGPIDNFRAAQRRQPAPRLRLARLRAHGGRRHPRGLRAHQGRRQGAGARAEGAGALERRPPRRRAEPVDRRRVPLRRRLPR